MTRCAGSHDIFSGSNPNCLRSKFTRFRMETFFSDLSETVFVYIFSVSNENENKRRTLVVNWIRLDCESLGRIRVRKIRIRGLSNIRNVYRFCIFMFRSVYRPLLIVRIAFQKRGKAIKVLLQPYFVFVLNFSPL